MNLKSRFLAVFFFLAFVMKVVGESVHEVMGHGFFVLLFGGDIVRVHISLLWPYEFSFIEWNGKFEGWQLIWIDGGGILICLIVSCMLQTLLLLQITKDWRLSTSLFWLSFWTFLNPTGYLIIGGIRPFGDVAALIAKTALTQTASLLIGVVIFTAAFFSISKILIKLFFNVGIINNVKNLRVSLCLFWLVIPVVTAINALGMRQPLFSLQIFTAMSFIPVIVAFIIPSLLLKKAHAHENTH